MGAASRGGSPATTPLGGAGAVLEVRPTQGTLWSNVTPGAGGWSDGGFIRYGGDNAALPGVTAWAAGSGGSTPIRGYGHALGACFQQARNNGAGTTPIDWYCGVMLAPVVQKPAVQLAQAFDVYEVGVQMMLSATPAAAITRDCGLVFMMSTTTSYPNVMRAGVAAGNDYAGFGVVFNGTTGELLWIVKKSGASGGAPLTESVSLGVYGALRIIPVKVRLYSATPAREARVEVFVDGVLRLTREWGTGTVLPVAADSTFSAQMGTFRPMMRAGQEVASNTLLCWRELYLKAAASAALLD